MIYRFNFIYLTDGEPPSDQDSLVFTLKAVGKPYKLTTAESSGARQWKRFALAALEFSALSIFLPAHNSLALDGEEDVLSKYTPVYSSEMVWEPQGDQVSFLFCPHRSHQFTTFTIFTATVARKVRPWRCAACSW